MQKFVVETDSGKYVVFAPTHEAALMQVCGGTIAIAANFGEEMFFTLANGEEVSVVRKSVAQLAAA